jgi:hypothetical protein
MCQRPFNLRPSCRLPPLLIPPFRTYATGVFAVLNGKCNEYCSEGQRFPEPQPLGVNAIGPSVALLFSDINGNAVLRYGMLVLQAVSILFLLSLHLCAFLLSSCVIDSRPNCVFR